MTAKTRIVFPLLLAAVLSGCGRPQVEPDNLPLIASLRTALSARDSEWLEQNAQLVDERHQGGQMSDKVYETFQAILEEARAGNWRDAEEDTLAFQKAQRPTDEQIEQVRWYWK